MSQTYITSSIVPLYIPICTFLFVRLYILICTFVHSIAFSLLLSGDENIRHGRLCFVRLAVNRANECQMSFKISAGILQNGGCRKEIKDTKKRDKK
jgi:hypothetical protein